MDADEHDECVRDFEKHAKGRDLPAFFQKSLHIMFFDELHGGFLRQILEFNGCFSPVHFRALANAMQLEIYLRGGGKLERMLLCSDPLVLALSPFSALRSLLSSARLLPTLSSQSRRMSKSAHSLQDARLKTKERTSLVRASFSLSKRRTSSFAQSAASRDQDPETIRHGTPRICDCCGSLKTRNRK